VVVHDNTGSNSGAAGGTFSKATFKVSRSSTDGNGENGTIDDIDIEDPDFWKKMIGEPKADEDLDILLTTKRRRRNQIHSYSEQEYTERLQAAIGNSEDESESAYESDDMNLDVGPNRERSNWGGSRPFEWHKDDAEHIARILATVGYGRISWQDFIKLIPFRKQYEESEVSFEGVPYRLTCIA
jgi:hypothetical protein